MSTRRIASFLGALSAVFLVALHARGAQAAGFDCAKARTPIEKMICQDDVLNHLDEDMAAAYQAARAANGNDRDLLLEQQNNWLKRRVSSCLITNETYLSEWHQGCARWITRGRIIALKYWIGRGQTFVFDQTPSVRAACETLLSRANIGWKRPGIRYADQFAVNIPPTMIRPAWTDLGMRGLGPVTLGKASFDLLNSGKEQTVYGIDAEFTHFSFHWFIAVEPGEEEGVAQKIQTAKDVDELADDFDRMPAAAIDTAYATANRSTTARRRAASFKSRLIDASNTDVYAGWYTHAEIILVDGITLFVVESVNDLGGPKFSILKPTPSGALELACYHNPLFSRVQAGKVVPPPGYRR